MARLARTGVARTVEGNCPRWDYITPTGHGAQYAGRVSIYLWEYPEGGIAKGFAAPYPVNRSPSGVRPRVPPARVRQTTIERDGKR